MTFHRIALCAFLLSLLFWVSPAFASPNPAAMGISSPTHLAVQGLSVYTVSGESPQRITISFRVVNLSSHTVTQPFRTSISPGANNFDGSLLTFYVTTPSLAGRQIVYMARTVTLPLGTGQVSVQAVADVDQVLTDPNRKNNTATIPFSSTPTKGYWVSIGPTKVTAPESPPYGTYSATGRPRGHRD